MGLIWGASSVHFVAHFLREGRAVISRALRVRVDALLTSDAHGGEQAADTDTHRAEVVDPSILRTV